MSRIAVIGAGLSGLSCAHALQARGHHVRVFDKSRGAGGRCATRRSAAGPFDHGAPSISAFGAQHPDWLAELARWAEKAWVVADVSLAKHWHAVPGINALAQHLAQGLSLQADTEIAAIEPASTSPPAHTARWSLRVGRGTAVEGEFDAVAVAVPAEQAAVLLGPSADLAARLRTVRSDPCWTVMAAWPRALPIDADRLQIDQGPLAVAVHDTGRPQRPTVAGVAQRWVLHAQAGWTRDNLDVPADEVVRQLLDAFSRAAGLRLARPSHAVAHRWRYAQVPEPLVWPCGWDANLKLGACGDAWHGADPAADLASDHAADGLLPADGLQRAWLSGRALAAAIHTSMNAAPA